MDLGCSAIVFGYCGCSFFELQPDSFISVVDTISYIYTYMYTEAILLPCLL